MAMQCTLPKSRDENSKGVTLNNKMSKAELKNYYSRCLAPCFLFFALTSLCERAIWAILRRVLPRYCELTQPKEVAKLRRLVVYGDDLPEIACMDARLSTGKLKLSIGWLNYDGTLNWSQNFDDQEVTVSLHRWSWLLYSLTDESPRIPRKQCIALMRSWIHCCLHDELFKKDAYSISERIVNGSIFLLNTGDRTIPTDIQNAFQHMGRQIANNLEYYEGDRTGNHAFNNGRGLFFAGIASGLPNAADLAFVIFQERLPKLVTVDGFLRESSSHYHFLFTRWVLEIRWLSLRSGHEKIAKFLEPYARKLVERCWFFLILNEASRQWNIPLVGDISPDFTPPWLLTLPWCTIATEVFRPNVLPFCEEMHGWAGLFGIEAGNGKNAPSVSATFPESFWHRIAHGELTLFVHAEAIDGRLHADHRHLDLGGFVLYHTGRPIFIDCGRSDYTRSKLSNYGRSAHSHNTVFVNGLSPCVEAPSWFQQNYKAIAVETELNNFNDATVFVIRHNGFNRLANVKIKHERRFTLSQTFFEIEDRFFGTKPCHLMLRFHLAPDLDTSENHALGWDINPIGALFEIDRQLQKKILVGQSSLSIGGLFSPEYGVTQECHTLELEGYLTLPATIKNKLIFKS